MIKFSKQSDSGFTIIELVVVIIILCILGTLVALTYSGVQANNRDNQRQADIDSLQSQLEVFYAVHNKYPSLAQINDPAWRTEHMKNLKDETVQDPQWSKDGDCSKDGRPTFAADKNGCYSYEVSASDGAECNNAGVPCAHYTLTARLENGQDYVKASLN